ncbi:MAG: hypothetical protein CMC38_07825 [Flavobacteriaceae bacterium]|nr:hypothetical protein [Flavobacteriaceae bacterium]|tara:strand:+ start:3948 stop:4556 length:609 start_codon:yes stop_codon:yes gene_type:complete
MKKLTLLFLLIPFISLSQEEVQKVEVIKSDAQIEAFTSSLGDRELRVDFLDLLVFPAISVGYEKINNSSSGFGTTLFLNLANSDTNIEWNDKFALTPFYRFYFLKSEDFGGYGIFAEIFSKFHFGKADKIQDSGEAISESFFDIAPGLAVGRKWINRNGFTFELYFGVGRNLLYKSDDNGSPFFPQRSSGLVRGGVSVGKRF